MLRSFTYSFRLVSHSIFLSQERFFGFLFFLFLARLLFSIRAVLSVSLFKVKVLGTLLALLLASIIATVPLYPSPRDLTYLCVL
jgi:hypothetical protein